MTAEKEILLYLNKSKNNHAYRYKGLRVGFLGLPDFNHYKYQTLANKCSDLKKKGYIARSNGIYFITKKGQIFLTKIQRKTFEFFKSEKSNIDPKNLLIIYDIPQDQTSHRNWLRRELKMFHFVMIQRSAWVGPSPLPKEFLEYIKIIGLKNTIKIFKLSKGYL